ncbi:hypothetical protein BH11VER1_BH11VER1_20780 [soil metagenome]
MSALSLPSRAIWLILLVVSLTPLQSSHAQTSNPATYATKVAFKKAVPLSFKDFDLTYTGERHETSKVFKPGFDFHDFTATRGTESVKVSWSSGTGDIGPTLFTIGGKKFQLELRRSDKLGKLKDDELVVSR